MTFFFFVLTIPSNLNEIVKMYYYIIDTYFMSDIKTCTLDNSE